MREKTWAAARDASAPDMRCTRTGSACHGVRTRCARREWTYRVSAKSTPARSGAAGRASGQPRARANPPAADAARIPRHRPPSSPPMRAPARPAPARRVASRARWGKTVSAPKSGGIVVSRVHISGFPALERPEYDTKQRNETARLCVPSAVINPMNTCQSVRAVPMKGLRRSRCMNVDTSSQCARSPVVCAP